jgi:hypothetical protein
MQNLFSGTDCPSRKMGTFCHNLVRDVVSQDRSVPRTVLTKECSVTKFLGRKILRTFRSGTFRQGTGREHAWACSGS